MTHIIVTTQGTLGDLGPVAHIGTIMKARGHHVTVITHCHYEGFIRRAGLEFAAVDSPEESEQYAKDSPWLHTPQGQIAFFRKHTLPRALREYEMIREQCRVSDTVLVAAHLFVLGPQTAAEKMGIPLVRVFGSVRYMAGVPLLEILCSESLAEDINRLRAKIGLSPVTDWHAWVRYPSRSIGTWPDWFAPPETDWPSGLSLTLVGFLTYDEADTGDAPAELQEFLDNGEPPVLITGGTSTYLKSEFYPVCVEACRLVNRRGVLVTRHPQLVPEHAADQVKWFQYLPFANVMPRMAAVVHHGGTGTFIRALTVGIPQLSLAAGADRPDNSRRFQRLGVAEYLPPSQWQPELIAHALRHLLDSPTVQERCQEMARRMREADPAAAVCRVIEGIGSGESRLEEDTDSAAGIGCEIPLPLMEGQVLQADGMLERLGHLSPEKRALLALRLEKKVG